MLGNIFDFNNQLVQGAVAAWVLTVVSVALRTVPSSIFTFIKRRLTSTIDIANGGWYNESSDHFIGFMEWFSKYDGWKWTRSYTVDQNNGTDCKRELGLSVGYGTHWFIYKGRLFWFVKTKTDTQTGNTKQDMALTCLGGSYAPLLALFEEFKYKRKHKTGVSIYTYGGDKDGFVLNAVIPPRRLETVVVSGDVKAKICNVIEEFVGDSDWYYSRGLAYKKTFLFHGIPGTGKTSLIKALASKYNRDVYVINIGETNSLTFERMMGNVKTGSFILIEDFDSCHALKRRSSMYLRTPARNAEILSGDGDGMAESTLEGADGSDSIQNLAELGQVSLTTVLNTLDGIVSLDDVLVFMTTNVLDQIDPAVYRGGRVDHLYEMGALPDELVREYYTVVYPGATPLPDNVTYGPVVGCRLQELFLDNRESPEAFTATLIAEHSQAM